MQLKRKKMICAVYGERAVIDWTCQKWFAKFRAADFSLDNAPQSGRSVEVDSDQIETLTENNQRCTMREIANILKISKSSIENHLHQLGYVNRFDFWAPHKWKKPSWPISASDSLPKYNENVPFLKQIVTADEKRILYNHVERKRSWGKQNEPPPTTPKAGFYPKKVMLCMWWDGRESSIMSSFQKTKRLIPTSTAPN